ncbi:hypothetical protein [Xanthomonas hortorum]|uniref:hypothetical protein n=1 Tax=Xanthomonas hortorum TaxID=56454 RepID=UPI00211565BA|nr:hypothetical protein [Xanthomonas hortorum]UUE99030.1 hypothetical protein NDY24_04105 [Xanthomonas hortorum pv. pelargonii]UUF03278.1 hypothetical protein NDY25_04425 [Xanthomonas hortorum pv. pelargonii]
MSDGGLVGEEYKKADFRGSPAAAQYDARTGAMLTAMRRTLRNKERLVELDFSRLYLYFKGG